ncbi:MAG: hypothetical protein DCC52_14470, partial [Chloroflexi bacterium]
MTQTQARLNALFFRLGNYNAVPRATFCCFCPIVLTNQVCDSFRIQLMTRKISIPLLTFGGVVALLLASLLWTPLQSA